MIPTKALGKSQAFQETTQVFTRLYPAYEYAFLLQP